jgi:plastocyanin
VRGSIPFVLLTALVATGLPTSAPASRSQAATELSGQSGPGVAIDLRDSSGNRVEQLAPGTYTITVRDLSDVHNFHLSGPGVDRSTAVDAVETVVWTVTLVDGTYTYECDAHPSVMRERFTVGAAPPPPPPPPPAPPPSPPPAATPTLVATLGPGAAISMKLAGKAVGSLRAGAYAVVVRDRSPRHAFRLAGPGVSRKTGDRFRGTVRWRVTFRAGVYRYWSSPAGVRRTLRVR